MAGAGPRRNRQIVLTYAAAWAADDRVTLAALSTPDLTCRWSGFGSEPVVAHGMAELLEHGRAFERAHGVADRYTMVESMGGQRHAAILFELDKPAPEIRHGARIAVYRLEGMRVAAIAVYGDRLD